MVQSANQKKWYMKTFSFYMDIIVSKCLKSLIYFFSCIFFWWLIDNSNIASAILKWQSWFIVVVLFHIFFAVFYSIDLINIWGLTEQFDIQISIWFDNCLIGKFWSRWWCCLWGKKLDFYSTIFNFSKFYSTVFNFTQIYLILLNSTQFS